MDCYIDVRESRRSNHSTTRGCEDDHKIGAGLASTAACITRWNELSEQADGSPGARSRYTQAGTRAIFMCEMAPNCGTARIINVRS